MFHIVAGMMGKPLLTTTHRSKLKPDGEQGAMLEELFKVCTNTFKERLNEAIASKATSRKKLYEAAYKGLRARYGRHLSHHIHTVTTHALAMFKSYRGSSRRRGNTSAPNTGDLSPVLLDDAHLVRFSWSDLKPATYVR